MSPTRASAKAIHQRPNPTRSFVIVGSLTMLERTPVRRSTNSVDTIGVVARCGNVPFDPGLRSHRGKSFDTRLLTIARMQRRCSGSERLASEAEVIYSVQIISNVRVSTALPQQ